MKKIKDKSEIVGALAKIALLLSLGAGLYTLALHWDLHKPLILFLAFNYISNLSKRI